MAGNPSTDRCWKDAVFAYTSGKHNMALSLFQQQPGDCSTLLLNRAFVLSAQSLYTKSLKIAAQVIARADELAPLALYHKGIINLKLGRVAEAVVDLTKIIGYVKPPLNFIATPGLMVPWDLHICEVLFNLALALFYLEQLDYSGSMLETAMHNIQTVAQQNAVARAIVNGFQSAVLFEIPTNLIFPPPLHYNALFFANRNQEGNNLSLPRSDGVSTLDSSLSHESAASAEALLAMTFSLESDTDVDDASDAVSTAFSDHSDFDEALDMLAVYRHSMVQTSFYEAQWSAVHNERLNENSAATDAQSHQDVMLGKPASMHLFSERNASKTHSRFIPVPAVSNVVIPPRTQSKKPPGSLPHIPPSLALVNDALQETQSNNQEFIPSVTMLPEQLEFMSRSLPTLPFNALAAPSPGPAMEPLQTKRLSTTFQIQSSSFNPLADPLVGHGTQFNHASTMPRNSTLFSQPESLIRSQYTSLPLHASPILDLCDTDFQGEMHVMIEDHGVWELRWCIVRGSYMYITTSKEYPMVLTCVDLNAIDIAPSPGRIHAKAAYSFHISYVSRHQMLVVHLSTKSLPLLLRWITFLLKASQGIQTKPMALVPIQDRRPELARVPLMEHVPFPKAATKPHTVPNVLHHTLTHLHNLTPSRKHTNAALIAANTSLIETYMIPAPTTPLSVNRMSIKPTVGPKNPARRGSQQHFESKVGLGDWEGITKPHRAPRSDLHTFQRNPLEPSKSEDPYSKVMTLFDSLNL
ncbi:hypothetical protein BDV3_006683 [Batrachochytrium dendrobatidis]